MKDRGSFHKEDVLKRKRARPSHPMPSVRVSDSKKEPSF